MDVTFNRVDVGAALAAGNKRPTLQLPRERLQEWWVVDKPTVIGQPSSWSIFKQGEYVAIPLFPYLLNREPDLSLAFMLAQALSVKLELGHRSVSHLHIATGVPVEALPEDPSSEFGIRYWCGFGLILD